MKKKEPTPEEIQMVCGEKLKNILSTRFGKSLMSFRHQRKTPEHIDLVVTWNNHLMHQESKLFLSKNFDIVVEEIPLGDNNIYLVSLHETIKSKSHNKIADFYKKNHKGQISESHIQTLLEKLNSEEVTKSEKSVDTLEANNEDAEEIVPTVTLPGPEIELGKLNFAEVPQSKESADTLEANNEDAEEIVPTVTSPNPEIELVERNENEPKFLLGTFLSHLLSFEGKLDFPTVNKSTKLFDLEVNKDSQVLYCSDNFIASNLEKAISWYVKKYFNDLPSVSCKNNKIVIRHCSIENKNKKTSIRAFCFTPNSMTTVLDMQKRLHRISNMTKPVVKKEVDHFKITYPSKRVAETIFETVSGMGWNTKIDDVNLFIFPLPLPNNPNDIEGKNIVKSSKAPDLNPFEKINMFSGTKAEAIDVLRATVLDLSFKNFSPEAQQKIIEALRKNWAENNPEAYALSAVDLLEN